MLARHCWWENLTHTRTITCPYYTCGCDIARDRAYVGHENSEVGKRKRNEECEKSMYSARWRSTSFSHGDRFFEEDIGHIRSLGGHSRESMFLVNENSANLTSIVHKYCKTSATWTQMNLKDILSSLGERKVAQQRSRGKLFSAFPSRRVTLCPKNKVFDSFSRRFRSFALSLSLSRQLYVCKISVSAIAIMYIELKYACNIFSLPHSRASERNDNEEGKICVEGKGKFCHTQFFLIIVVVDSGGAVCSASKHDEFFFGSRMRKKINCYNRSSSPTWVKFEASRGDE